MDSKKNIYEVEIKYNNPILEAHQVHGVRILPGVTLIDMMYRFLSKEIDTKEIYLKDLLFFQPISAIENSIQKIRIERSIGENFQYITIHCREVNSNQNNEYLVAKCQLCIGNRTNDEPIDIYRYKKESIHHINMKSLYENARELNILHGAFMKAEGTIYRGQDYVLAEIKLNEHANKYLDHFYLHPVFLDASTFIPTVLNLEKNIEKIPYIPLSITHFYASKKLPESVFVFVKQRKEDIISEDISYADILITDLEGNVIASFDNLSAKRIRRSEHIKLPTGKKTVEGGGKKGNPGNLKNNYQNLSLEEQLVQMMKDMLGDKNIVLRPGDGFYDMGLESVDLIQYVKVLEDYFNITLYPTLLFEKTTFKQLSTYLSENYEGVVTQKIEKLKNQSLGLNQIENKEMSVGQDIAVVGISGRYPGSENIREFWKNLVQGKDLVTEIPDKIWDYKPYFSQERNRLGKTYCKWGGFIKDSDCFDPMFFNLSPKEAKAMDPQERLFLQSVWEVIEDAGYTRESFSEKNREGELIKVGIYVGVMWSEYQLWGASEFLSGNGSLSSSWFSNIPNRASYFFNFNGPSIAIDTACSSSLLAIHLACESLLKGECLSAIAGGVNLSLHPNKYTKLSYMQMLSAKGKCHSFGADADGYVPGEGVGALLLKPLSEAIRDKDHIYGVIKGTEVNHSGKSAGYSVPKSSVQGKLIKDNLDKAKIPSESISYIEAHGTGTELGDPIEIEGIKQAFITNTHRKQFIRIGSLKSNIGHLESAAGIAGITKVLLQMNYNHLVPTLHCNPRNPKIAFEDSPVCLQEKSENWFSILNNEQQKFPLRSMITSLGAGGVNVNAILEARNEEVKPPKENLDISEQLIKISAMSQEQLIEYIHRYIVFLESETYLTENHVSLASIAYTLEVGREDFDCRVVLCVKSIASIKNELCKLREFPERILTKQVILGEGVSKESSMIDIGREWLNSETVSVKENYPKISYRVSLPTYPFLKDRYWVDTKLSKVANDKPGHPLLHYEDSSDRRVEFSTTLTSDMFWFKDHQFYGTALFPGAGLLEMLYAGAQIGFSLDISNIKGMVWMEPVVSTKSSLKLTTTVTQNADGMVAKISSNGDGECHTYSVCNFPISENLEKQRAEKIDISTIKNRCQQIRSQEEIYAGFKDRGILYGAPFKTLQGVHSNGKEALGLIKVVDSDENYLLNPLILDGAIQTVSSLIPSNNVQELNGYLPYKIDDIAFFSAVKTQGYIHVIQTNKNENEFKFDVTITDEEGVISVKFTGLSVHKNDINPKIKSNIDPEVLIAAPEWVQVAPSRCQNLDLPYVLILDEDEGLRNSVKHLFHNSQVYFLKPTQRCHQISEFSYEINPEEQSHYDWLLNHLPKASKWTVIDFWRYAIDSNSTSEHGINEQLSTGVIKHFLLTKSFMLNKVPLVRWISFVDLTNPLDAALGGFSKSVYQENPHYNYSVYYIDKHNDSKISLFQKAITEEFKYNSVEVQYKQDQRYEKRIVHKPFTKMSGMAIKKRGRYLITGGCGGLGLIFASHFLSHYQATLILAGRTPYNERIEEKLMALRKLGSGEVTYISADLSQKKESERLISEIGIIDGVVHSAGTLKDSLVIQKTLKEFANVLESKIHTTIFIQQATRHLDLDFFVSFSSLSALFGNQGQSDYSAGNSFLDAYSEKYGGVSIEWPYWDMGGMKADSEFNKVMLSKTGISTISNDEAIHVFHRVMGLKNSTVMIMPGSSSTITRLLQPLFSKGEMRASNNSAKFSIKECEKLIIDGISDELNWPRDRIDLSKGFDTYGLDSISMARIIERLETTFGILPKTLFFEHNSPNSMAIYLSEIGVARSEKEKKTNVPVEKVQSKIYESSKVRPQDIAIIGVEGQYPQADNMAMFWKLLSEGRNAVTTIPKDRWDYALQYDATKGMPGKTYSKWGGFINNVTHFDPLFFNISPTEAEMLDPQERLFLETVWKVMIDAGYSEDRLQKIYNNYNRPIGVFVGVMNNDYRLIGLEEQINKNEVQANSSHWLIPNRISYYFNFNGPSLAVDTACSSSVTAMNLACDSLINNKCEMAIAGGVNLILHPRKYTMLSSYRFLSSDGKCRSFGDGGDGYVPGEGVGAVLLKPLTKAIEDKDNIYAVIKSIEINHGGKTSGFSVPNPKAQGEVIQRAVDKSGLQADDITCIEAHGTGTELGDPIEIIGLNHVYQPDELGRKSYSLGSLKSNIGHLESAAGIAGLTKVILQMRHNKLVPTLHSENENPNINLTKTSFSLQHKLDDWEEDLNKVKAAGLSSFGAGGSNAHMIIEEYKSQDIVDSFLEENIFIFSAPSDTQLTLYIKKMIEHFNTVLPVPNLKSIAYTLQIGRDHYPFRVAIVANTLESLIKELNKFHNRESSVSVISTTKSIPGLLEEAEETTMFLHQLYSNKNFQQLGKLWVSGAAINWQEFYKAPESICSLPIFDLDRKEYWVHKKNNLTTQKPKLGMFTPSLNGVTYTITLTQQNELLSQHLVNSKPTLPGAAYPALAKYVLDELGARGILASIKNLKFLSMFQVEENSKEITLIITKLNADKSDRTYDLVVSTGKQYLATANLVISSDVMVHETQKMTLDTLFERFETPVTSNDLYDAFETKGISYGGLFRRIENIYFNSNECLVSLKHTHLDQQFELDPITIDVALQSLGILLHKDDAGLPISIEEISIDSSFPMSPKYIYTVMLPTQNKDVKRANSVVLDKEGRVLLRLFSIGIKSLSEKKSGSKLRYLQPKWQEIPFKEGMGMSWKRVLIFTSNMYKEEEFCKKLYDDFDQVEFKKIQIAKGMNFEQIIDDFPDYQDIIFINQYMLSSGAFIYDELQNTQELGVLALLNLSQILIKKQKKYKVFVLFNDCYDVLSEPIRNPFSASLIGFVNVLVNEQSMIKVNSVEYQTSEVGEIKFDRLFNQILAVEGSEFAVRKNKIYKKQLDLVHIEQKNIYPLFKEFGSYLIIGGMGGVGFEFAKTLCRKFKANLMVVGASALDSKRKEKIAILENLGGKAVYFSGDISDSEVCHKIVSAMKDRFGGINGVVHSAITLFDQSIQNLSIESFRHSMKPKVQGVVNLERALQNIPLDFFCSFSSANSFFGNPGQSSYVAATTFKDAYVNYLRQKVSYPVHIINWGYWGDVGVVSNEFYRQKMEQWGIYGIKSNEGVNAFFNVLGGSVGQLMVIKLSEVSLSRLISLTDDKKVAASNSLEHFKSEYKKITTYGQYKLCSIFEEELEIGSTYTIEEIEIKFNLLKKYKKLFRAVLAILQHNGFITINQETVTFLGREGNEEIATLQEALESSLSTLMHPYLVLLDICLKQFREILGGKKSAIEVIFPNASTALVEKIYRNNPLSDLYNQIVAKEVVIAVKNKYKNTLDNRRICILEIGAGTGGTTQKVIEAIQSYSKDVHYFYSDIGTSLLTIAENSYSHQLDHIEFKRLDIEEDPILQGWDLHQMDIIIASNVLHATKDIQVTLENIQKLSKRNGCLIINELTSVQDYTTLTFGLLDDWWCFRDNELRIHHSPLISVGQWKELLQENGWHVELSSEGEASAQNVFVSLNQNAEKKHEILQQVSYPMPSAELVALNINDTPVMDIVKDIFSSVLKVEKRKLDPTKTFDKYGVDSLGAMEISKRLSAHFENIPNSVLYEYITIQDLSDYLTTTYPDKNKKNLSKKNIIPEDDMLIDTLKKVENGQLEIQKAMKVI